MKIRGTSINNRGKNYSIDTIVCCIPQYILTAILGFDYLRENQLFVFLSLIATTAIYYYVSESRFGTTIGKKVTDTFLITKEGKKPTNYQVLKRMILRLWPIVGIDAASFFFLNRGFHDSFSETWVVDRKELNRINKPAANSGHKANASDSVNLKRNASNKR